MEDENYFYFDSRTNDMELWLVLLPFGSDSEKPTLLDIKNTCIIEGFHCDLAEVLIEEKIKNHSTIDSSEFLIGNGVQPKKGKDAVLEFCVSDPRDKLNIYDDYDRKDYRTHTQLICVKKDQELLQYFQETSGKAGVNILGQIIEGIKGKAIDITFGKNVSFIADLNTLYAKCEGCFFLENNICYIDEVYIVDKDLDMSIGNIDTTIPILIQGDVKPGFQVKSLEDIRIEGNVEESIIRSEKGKVLINGGILGQKSAIIYGKEGVHVKYSHHAMISSDNDIIIDESLIQSNISCGKTLVLSSTNHGSIIGGSIRISDSIKAQKIGSPSEPRTNIFMGFDFEYEPKLHELDKKIISYEKEIIELKDDILDCEKLIHLYKNNSSDQQDQCLRRQKIIETINKTEEILFQAKKELSDLEKKALLEDVSSIEISDIIYGNTFVYMRSKFLNISDELNNVKIYLRPIEKEIEIVVPEKND
jgi:uncharacterized protein (DUF342 family)